MKDQNASQIAVIASAVIALIGSVLSAALALIGNNYLQNRAKNKDDQLRVLRELQGIRIKLRQDMVTRFEALIHMAYHEAKVIYYVKHTDVKQPIPNLDLEQAKRWSLKGEKWTVNITDDTAELSRILCETSVLFRNDTRLQDRISKFLLDFPTPELANAPDESATLDEINEWDTKTVKELLKLVDKLYYDPLAQIISEIDSKIKKSNQSRKAPPR